MTPLSRVLRLAPAAHLAVLAAAMLAAQPAFAIDFRGDGPTIWVERSARLITAAKSQVTSRDQFNANMKEACSGVGGELLKIGGSAPIWAAEGHRAFCRSVDGFTGSPFVKDPCGELKKAVGYYGKARAEDHPADVVKAAGSLIKVADVMRELNADRRRCK